MAGGRWGTCLGRRRVDVAGGSWSVWAGDVLTWLVADGVYGLETC